MAKVAVKAMAQLEMELRRCVITFSCSSLKAKVREAGLAGATGGTSGSATAVLKALSSAGALALQCHVQDHGAWVVLVLAALPPTLRQHNAAAKALAAAALPFPACIEGHEHLGSQSLQACNQVPQAQARQQRDARCTRVALPGPASSETASQSAVNGSLP